MFGKSKTPRFENKVNNSSSGLKTSVSTTGKTKSQVSVRSKDYDVRSRSTSRLKRTPEENRYEEVEEEDMSECRDKLCEIRSKEDTKPKSQRILNRPVIEIKPPIEEEENRSEISAEEMSNQDSTKFCKRTPSTATTGPSMLGVTINTSSLSSKLSIQSVKDPQKTKIPLVKPKKPNIMSKSADGKYDNKRRPLSGSGKTTSCIEPKSLDEFLQGRKLLAENVFSEQDSRVLCVHNFADMTVDLSDFHQVYSKLCFDIPKDWIVFADFLLRKREGLINMIKNETNLSVDINNDEIKQIQVSAEGKSLQKIEELIFKIKYLFENRQKLKKELTEVSKKLENLENSDNNDELKKEMDSLALEYENEKKKTKKLTKEVETLEEKFYNTKLRLKELESGDGGRSMKTTGSSSIRTRDMSSMTPSNKVGNQAKKQEIFELLERRCSDLKNRLNDSKEEYEKEVLALTDALEKNKKCLEMKQEQLDKEKQETKRLKAALKESEAKFEAVKAKERELIDLVEKTKLNVPDHPSPTNREAELWTELEASRIAVKGYQEKVENLKKEKKTLLLSFENIAADENQEMSEKYAAQIVKKDETIQQLKQELQELQTKCDSHGEAHSALQLKLEELQCSVRKSGGIEQWSLTQQIQLLTDKLNQQEELINNLLSHNKELEDALTKKSIELEQRDRIFEQQSSIVRVRDDLINLLQQKENKQHHDKTKLFSMKDKDWEKKAEKICKDLAEKSQNLAEMENILQEKYKQVENLSRLVKKMEEQQDRNQEQRVRYEAKIAGLQKQLLLKKNAVK